MNTLRARLNELASSFANSVLEAIRGASIEELVGESAGSRRGPGRPPAGAAHDDVTSARPGRRKPGRLARRSSADIQKSLASVVALVKKHPKGMRSEEIRKALHLDVREMPRVLKEGLAKKGLRSKGHKRATTYFAA